MLQSKDAERSLAIFSLFHCLGVAIGTYSFHGRLNILGPGSTTAVNMRRSAAKVETEEAAQHHLEAVAPEVPGPSSCFSTCLS